MVTFTERAIGGIIGVAVGDALGVPVEFVGRETLRSDPVTGMRAYGTHRQPAGTWSDDTSLTLCTAETILDGFDGDRTGDAFVDWFRKGRWTAHGDVFDIGNTTRTAIGNIESGTVDGFPTTALEAGPRGEGDNGNGALMRILPVAIRHWNDDLLSVWVSQAAGITHGHLRSGIACVSYSYIARQLLRGVPVDEAVAQAALEVQSECVDNPPHLLFSDELRRFDRVMDSGFKSAEEQAIRSSGYVVYTLEAAVWCLLTTENYRDCVLKAVNLGDDADTTGAVAGGLAGIAYGIGSIPEDWLQALARREDVLALATELAGRSTS